MVRQWLKEKTTILINKLFPCFIAFIIPNEKGALMNFNTLLYDYGVRIVKVDKRSYDDPLIGEWYICTCKGDADDIVFLKTDLSRVFTLRPVSTSTFFLLPKRHCINKEKADD